MMRLTLGLTVLLLTAGCSLGGGSTDGDGPTAKSVKQETDKVADAVVAGLADRLGADVNLRAYFVECQITGEWRYTGNGQVQRPQGGKEEIAEAIRAVLGEAGLEAAVDASDLDVSGKANGLTFSVNGAGNLGATKVPILNVVLDTECADYPDRSWAEEQDFRDFSAP